MVFLSITDITGRTYPYQVTEAGIKVEDVVVTPDNYCLDDIRSFMENYPSITVENRIFRTEHIIEISVNNRE